MKLKSTAITKNWSIVIVGEKEKTFFNIEMCERKEKEQKWSKLLIIIIIIYIYRHSIYQIYQVVDDYDNVLRWLFLTNEQINKLKWK